MTRQVKRKKLIHALAEMYGVTWAGVEEGLLELLLLLPLEEEGLEDDEDEEDGLEEDDEDDEEGFGVEDEEEEEGFEDDEDDEDDEGLDEDEEELSRGSEEEEGIVGGEGCALG